MPSNVVSFVYGGDRGPAYDDPYEYVNACDASGDREIDVLIGYGMFFEADWCLEWGQYAVYRIPEDFSGDFTKLEDCHLQGECIAGEPWIRPDKNTFTLSITLEDK